MLHIKKKVKNTMNVNKKITPVAILLLVLLIVSGVGNLYLYTSLSSANAEIESMNVEYETLESDVEDIKSRVATLENDTTSLENEIVELKKSKLWHILTYAHYLNEITVTGTLFNYGMDAADGISIKMTWYDALDNKVYEAIMVVEDVSGGESQDVFAKYAYVGLIEDWSYTIHWNQGEISYP